MFWHAVGQGFLRFSFVVGQERLLGGPVRCDPSRVLCSAYSVALGCGEGDMLSWHVHRSTRQSCVVELLRR